MSGFDHIDRLRFLPKSSLEKWFIQLNSNHSPMNISNPDFLWLRQQNSFIFLISKLIFRKVGFKNKCHDEQYLSIFWRKKSSVAYFSIVKVWTIVDLQSNTQQNSAFFPANGDIKSLIKMQIWDRFLPVVTNRKSAVLNYS